MAIARPPSTYDGRTTTGNPIAAATSRASVARRRDAARRLRDVQLRQERREALAILGQVDRVGRGAENPHAGFLQRQRELERRLTAELHQADTSPPADRSVSITAITSSNVSGWK